MFARLLSPSAVQLLVLATVAAALKGIFVKLAYLAGGEPVSVLLLRVAMATPLFWLLARGVKQAQRLRVRDRLRAMGLGALYFVAAICDFTAIDRLGAGPSRVLLFSYPLVVLLLEARRDRRRPAPGALWAFGLAWVGLVLLLRPGDDKAWLEVVDGVAWGLGAAVGYALYLHLGERTAARMGVRRYHAWAQSGAAIPLLVLLPWVVEPEALTPSVELIGWTAIMVVISTVIPFLLLFEGIRRTSAGFAGLVSLLGPVVTMAIAWWVFDERLGAVQLVGALLVLSGVALLRRVDRGRPRGDRSVPPPRGRYSPGSCKVTPTP